MDKERKGMSDEPRSLISKYKEMEKKMVGSSTTDQLPSIINVPYDGRMRTQGEGK